MNVWPTILICLLLSVGLAPAIGSLIWRRGDRRHAVHDRCDLCMGPPCTGSPCHYGYEPAGFVGGGVPYYEDIH